MTPLGKQGEQADALPGGFDALNHSILMPWAPGTRLGPYEILGPVGADGMGGL